MKRTSIISLLLFVFICSKGQQKEKHPLTQAELNRTINSAFNRLVSANPNPGEIANYASLDPINATFKLKGSVPVISNSKVKNLSFEDQIQQDKGKISYLSFEVSGNLTDKNYASLFSDGTLNAGVSITGYYNFMLGTPKFAYFNENWNAIAMKRELLLKSHYKKRIVLENTMNDAHIDRNKYQLTLREKATDSKLSKKAIDCNSEI